MTSFKFGRILVNAFLSILIIIGMKYTLWPVIAQSSFEHQLQAIAWSPDGNFIAYSAGEDICTPDIPRELVIINAVTKNHVHTLPLGECVVIDLDWSPDSARLAGASWDKFGFQVWDVSTGQRILLSQRNAQGMLSIDWHPTLDQLLLADVGGAGAIVNATTGDFLRGLVIPASRARWNPDAEIIASVRSDLNKVYIERELQRVVLTELQLPARTLDWSPDGNKLATAGYDNMVKIWDSNTGQELASLSVLNIWDVRWNLNSRQLAVASLDGFVQVWDTETGQITDTYTNQGVVTAIAWSPDGTQLAYGGVGFSGELTIVEPNIIVPSIIIVESDNSTDIIEGSSSDTYTLALRIQPKADVIINIAGDAQISIAPTTLTFTPENWDVSQIVMVLAVDDSVIEGAHTAVITHSAVSDDAGYDGIAVASVTVTIGDNDSE